MPNRDLTITRTFDAPRALVFQAWTEPGHFVRWWGPHGYTTPFCSIDLRPGGRILFCMRSPEGFDIWNGGVFQEIVVPERIVYTDYFADEKGNPVSPVRYGMSADFPPESLVTVTFVEHAGKTTLTLQQTLPELIAERNGARQGWGESFDRLADYLTGKT